MNHSDQDRDHEPGGPGDDPATSALIRNHATRHRASPALAASIRAEIALQSASAGQQRSAQPRWRWLAWPQWPAWLVGGSGFAGGLAAAFALMLLAGHFTPGAGGPEIDAELTASHVRSLMAGHLTDVTSTDQHTVKPWFNGRTDQAPPVIDLTAQGFTLIGGRLDFIDGKSVAVIVYRRRVHVINLFVTQGVGSSLQAPRMETVQGFNILRWTDQGLNMLAVSDINREELEEFGSKFEQAARAARAT